MPKAAITKPPSWRQKSSGIGALKKGALSKPLGGKRFQIKCSMKWIWKIQLCRISGKVKDLFKKNGVLLLFPSPWPLSQIPHGGDWAHLTRPPLGHSVALVRDPLAAKWKFKLKLRSLLSFRMHWLCFVCPQWLTLVSLQLIQCLTTENHA